MAARSVSRCFFQVTLWTLKSWMVVYLCMSWTDCYNGIARRPPQQHVIYIPPQGVLHLLPDTSSVTEHITSILWKHGPNKAAEWDLVLGPDVDYYGTFKKRTKLDKRTGQLVINNMTIEAGVIYSVDINGRLLDTTYMVKQMKKVPRPLVATKEPCDSNSTSCEVHCVLREDVTESGPVTYLWKKDEGEWMESDSGPNSHRLIVTRDEDGKVKTLTCAVKNEFSMERSDPEHNWLYHEGPPPEPTPKPTPTGGIVAGVFVALIIGAVGLVLGVIFRNRIRKMFSSPESRRDPEETKPLEAAVNPAGQHMMFSGSSEATGKIPREWLSISKRWRLQLEKLANMDHCDVTKIGNLVFATDSEFHIAEGNNGTAVFVGLRDDGTEVAVKRMTSKKISAQLENEQDFLRLPELVDPSIVRYVDYVEDRKHGYLVLELCEYTLEEYYKKEKAFPGGSLCERELAKQVLTGLEKLHEEKILHRDIKPQNVLIDIQNKARLADFGISRRFPQDKSTLLTKAAGTSCWMATEILVMMQQWNDGDIPEIPHKTSTDIQVAGMLVYYILSGGEHPFGSGIRCQVNIYDGIYNLEHVKDVVAKDLIEKMINTNPEKRPTVEKCLAHPFFWSYERRVDFLIRVAKEKEIEYYENPEHLMAVLNQCSEEGLFDAWKDKMKDKLPEVVFEEMMKGRKESPYLDDGFGLLRFICNLHEHHAEAVANIDLMEMFPGLVPWVYKFVQNQGWNKRITLEEFFTHKS